MAPDDRLTYFDADRLPRPYIAQTLRAITLSADFCAQRLEPSAGNVNISRSLQTAGTGTALAMRGGSMLKAAHDYARSHEEAAATPGNRDRRRHRTMNQTKLLIVEHDAATRTLLEHALRDRYALAFADTRRKALALLAEMQPDIVSLDLALPGSSGTSNEALRTLEEMLNIEPTTRIIVVAAIGGDRINTQRAIQSGAVDYLAKPLDLAEYEMVLKRVAYQTELEAADADTPTGEVEVRVEKILENTPGMREVFGTVSLVAKTDATVLIQGESGTGKELLARAVHARSRRQSAPFVPINCGAIPEGLLEAELFGHERGAYTGAHVQRKGKLELADTGTVFLDEIAEMSLPLQVKLLRFLQEREIERIGGRQRIRINTRVIAATNKDPKVEVAAGRLREDLYFRLSVVTIVLPPLRERREDIGILANEFLRQNCQTYRRKLQFSPEAMEAILHHRWPGNIRELENAIQRAVILTRGRLIEPAGLGIAAADGTKRLSLREARRRAERQVVLETLTRTQGNISRAAVELGISRPTMHDLLHKHQIAGKDIRCRQRSVRGVTSGDDSVIEASALGGHPATSSSDPQDHGAR
jgi:two-component system NtrC family response regulator